jgi:hypothetical protein
MPMRRSGVLDRFSPPGAMPKAPPLQRPDVRSSDHDVGRMTGKSGPAGPPGHHHIKYHQLGDHRQGLHSGSANSSAVPHISAGKPQIFGRNGRSGNGNDAA